MLDSLDNAAAYIKRQLENGIRPTPNLVISSIANPAIQTED